MTRKSRPFWSRLTQAMTAQAVKTDVPQSQRLASAVRPLALEQRFMFDGAAAVDVAHAATDSAAPAAAEHTADAASALRHALTAEALRATEGPAGSTQRQEVVFVDNRVQDYQQLISGLKPGTEVVVLDSSKDGLQQIANYLDGRSGIDVVHVLSHGDTGKVQLGNLWLDSQNLASHSQALASLGKALSADGDILLYGCEIGADGAGRDFIESLARSTGADVAASTNLTGAQSRGGDWVLETSTGSIEAALPFALADVRDYDGVLGAPVSGTTDFGSGGDDTTLASGPGNLGVTAQNVRGSGWDVTVTTTTATNISIAAGDLYFNTDDGIYYADSNFDGEPLQSFKVASNSGSIFDLKSVDVTIASQSPSDEGQTILLVTGYRNGVAVSGASQSFNIAIFGGQSNLETLDLSVNSNFVGVDSFVITRSSGLGVIYLGIDNINAASVRAPTLAPSMSATGVNPTFTEKGSAVDLFSIVTTSTNDVGQLFSGMTLRVTNVSNEASEILNVGGVDIGLSNGNSGSLGGLGNFSVILVGGTATVTLSGMTRDNTQMAQLIDAMTYRNASDNPGSASRVVSITNIVDSGSDSTNPGINSSVTVIPVNDAPNLGPANNTVSYTENSAGPALSPALTLVDDGSSFQRATVTISDLRIGDILSVGSPGVFSSSYNAATGVLTITGGGNAAALQAVLRSVSFSSTSDDPTFGGSDTSRQINFVVTDSAGADSNTAVAQVTIVAVNDAPTLSGGPYIWAGTNEDLSSQAVTVNSLLAGTNYADVDGPTAGIALTASTGSGLWQYSTDGIAWTSVGAVSNVSALLLSGSTLLRYIPDGANGGAAALTFRAWDQSAGSASVNGVRYTSDTSTNGGSTAFSTGTAQATLSVSSVNDAPVLTPVSPTLPGLTDGSINNNGVLVGSLYGANYTDVDTGALKGIAITSLNSGNGTWQYSLDGTTWSNVGTVSASSALLLRASDHVRFVPDGINGTSASVTFRAWDQTGLTNGMQGNKVDASSAGGITAFSVGFNTASITVTAVNDAPTLTGSGGNLTWTEGNNTTSIPVVVDSGLSITDADGPYIASATARISNNYSSGNDSLELVSVAATMGNIIGTWDAGTGTLTLRSAGNLASLAQFQAALQAVTFTNLSDTPTVGTRTVEFKVNDGSLDSLGVSRNIAISAVDDAPVITAPTSITVVEDIATVLSNISINDPDSVNIVMTLSVTSGTLGAIGGAGVAVGGTSTAMTLSGTIANVNAFISNNRVSYTTAANATADATLTVTVDTGSVGTDTKTITLSITPVNDAPVVSVPVSLTVTEDVPGSVTGISFSDLDAGSASVTATFSVPSGVLRAVSGSGVTVDGSGTGTLTLSGSLSDINTFIAATRVSFQTALNSTDSVLLSVSINDNGNTGGGGQTDSKTVIINVTAVNDAPVNSVPGAQSTKQNEVLAFNTLKGNTISVNDPDAGSSNVIVILNSVNGTMSLTAASGVTFVTGDGVDDTSIRMQGTLAALNTTLQSLTFRPTTGFLGNAQMSIQTNDMGFSGSGGAKTDFDLILITVVPGNPLVTSVSTQGLDRTVKIGDEVLINMVFDQTVKVDLSGGSPSLLLETGLLDSSAVYMSGSGSNTLVFKYIVQAGDISADLDFQSTAALQLNNAVLTNTAGDVAILTLPTVGGANSLGGRSNIVVDGVVPVVTSVGMPSDGSYIIGQNLDFTVNFSENVVVNTLGGIPRIAVTLDTGGTVYAQYTSGSGSSALVFRLVVASGQLDSTGVTLGSSLDPNGGSIHDAAGNDSVTALNNVASTTNVKVDGVVPTVVSVSVPADGSYKAGSELSFTMTASEAVQIGGLAPRLVLNVGGVTRYATYISGSGSSALTFQYVVQSGDNDSNGIMVSSLDLRGEQLTDLAGNDLNLALNSMGSTVGVMVDTTAPTGSSIVRVDSNPTNSGSVRFTVTFDEYVSGVDASDFNLTWTGTASGTIANVTSVDDRTYTVLVNGIGGEGTLGLDLKASGTGIIDAAGNAITGGLTGASYTIDRVAPSVVNVSVPANGTYVARQNLDFTVHFNEAVQVDTTGGTPSIAVTLDTGGTVYASYVSGAGTSSMMFRLTVASGQLDTDGISLGNIIQLNGATMRDAMGNDVITSLNSVANTANVRVDAIPPTATIVVSDTALAVGETSLVTITFSEAVSGFDNSDLTVGSGTLSTVSSSDGGITWTATFTPAAGITHTGNLITLNNTGYADAAGNTGTGATDSNSYAIDTQRPTATIVVADTALAVGETSLVTITFSEAVSGFDNSDLTVGNGTLSTVSSSDGGITWTATFTPAAGITHTGNLITLNNTGYADAAGNTGTGATDSNSYAIDTQRPTATIVVADTALAVGETSLVTISFSEAVSGFDNSDLTVGNGTLSTVSSSDGGITWTATFTPAAGITHTGNLITLNNTGYADAAGNTGTGATDSNSYAIDTQRPTATIVVADTALAVGETSLVTISFSEAVSGLTTSDFSVANGSLSDLSSSDGGLIWTATLTPTFGVTNTSNLITLNNTGYADAAGNTGTGATDSNSYAIDTQRPTATIVVADTALAVGETSLVTISFSEAVSGLTTSDFSVANGSLSDLSSSDGGLTWTATLTPTVGVTNTSNLITLNNTGYVDAAGNTGTGATDSNSYAIDTQRPTATIVVADTALAVGETSLVTISFSEAVSGLTTSDFSVANGSLSDLSSSDGGLTWTATLTPTVGVTNTSNLITLNNTGYADAAGNTGTGATDSNSYAIDTQRPTATIVVADTALAVGETSLVTISFSEAVSGLTTSDFSVANGSLSDLSSSDGGLTWTATLTPTVGVTNTSNLITLNNTGYADAAGNTGTGATDSNSYAIDTQRPTATIVVADTALAVGETSLVTISFSEAVSGLTTSDFSVANGSLSDLSSSDGGLIWTATLTPTFGVTNTSNLITLNNTGYADAAGNTGTGATDSNSYAIDTQRPTATIVVADTALAVGETSLVTISFSEAVSGLTTSDFSVANGSLSDLSSSDGGLTWTATLTPTVGVTNTSNLITLNNTGYVDAAGNTGTGATDSNSYAIDTQRPTATIVVADTALAVGETSLVTISFSEAVSGLTTSDFSVANGSLSDLSSSDGGLTWTATLTPTVGVTNTSNLITLNNTGYADAAGNTGTGATDSNSYAIDTQRPTATIVVADTALAVGETSLVTISFSEAVSGLTTSDFSVANGSLSDLSSSDGGLTWTATLTPTVGVTNTSNLITLNNTGYVDAAGNTGTGATDSNSYAIDTQRPTATIVVADTALAVGETSLVTISFSEAVSGLTTSDFSVANGSLSDLSSSDGGLTWTATLTPTVGVTNTSNLITLNNTGYADAAGNTGTGATDSNSYAIDTQRPTATIVVADTALAVGETSLVTISFSEAVSGLTTSDFSVANGSLSDLSSSDGGLTWTATLTPTVGVTNTSNLITLNNTGYVDAAGNTGTGATDSNSYAIDTQRPTATIVVADTALAVGETSLVTISFSEAVSGLTTSDFSVANGSLSDLSSSDGGLTWTATLTPTVGVTNTSNLITLNNTGYADAAGNTGTGATDSNSYAIDTQRPTATIVVADTALAVGETSLVTISFSEAVSGLTTSDFSVANGSLSDLSSSDGGLTWTATFTPAAGITSTANVITLNNTGYADAAGNTGTGATDSNSYAIDTQRPTATIVVADTALAVGETSLVTISFSEAVSGLTTSDFSVANGSLSDLSSSDGGLTWTATFTPAAGITSTANVITLNNTGYADAAGNTGTGATDSNSYAIDTQRPTATIVVADTALAVGETSLVTITFSEAVTGFTNADLTITNGTLSEVSSKDGGITWTATLTPTTSVTNTSNVITLDNTGYVDAAGNSGTGTSASNAYAIDTLDPVAPRMTLDQTTLVNERQVSPTGLVFVSGLETGGSWQYSLNNGASWIEGRGNTVQLPGLGAFSLWVQQRDAAGNLSTVTALSGIVEPLIPPNVQLLSTPTMNDALAELGLAPFQPSEVSEPNADFLRPASTVLQASSQSSGMFGAEGWSGHGIPQSIAGLNDWIGMSLFAPTEAIRYGFDPAPAQFSVSTGASILDLRPVLLASDSPWDIASLRFSFADRQELPGWVRLDRQSGQLTINAPKDLSTTLVLQIKVSDGKGHESVRTLKVVVGDARVTSSAPAGRAGLSEKMANAANQQAGKRMSQYVHG